MATLPDPSPDLAGVDVVSDRFTLAGCVQGFRMAMPLLPGIIVFAIAYGAAAVAKGLSLGEAVAKSAFVYAGLSQMVALEFWRPEWSASALVGLALVTAAINGRMVLQGASLQPWLSGHSNGFNLAHLFLLTDASWLVTERYRAAGGKDLGILIGSGFGLWVVWVLAAVPGHLLGNLVGNPRAIGLDLLMPIYFVALLVPLWKGRINLWPWLVAGVVALVSARLLQGYSYVVLGSLAGAVTGAFGRDD